MHTLNLGNNETIARGIYQDNNGFTALTYTQSKTFKTKKGAVAWLAARGYDENGNRMQ